MSPPSGTALLTVVLYIDLFIFRILAVHLLSSFFDFLNGNLSGGAESPLFGLLGRRCSVAVQRSVW